MTLSQADIDSLLGPQPADSVESLLDAPITGEDISLAMQDPAFTPTQADYLKYEEYAKNKQTDWVDTIAQSVDAAAGMIGGAISEGAQGAVINPLNYIEGAAQGTRQLYGLVAQSQDPGSPLFKFKDLVAGSGTVQSRYEQFLEARDFANRSARLESGEDFLAIQPEFTNPEFVQGVSMILDPTLALPGIGEILGAGKLATRAVGKGAQLTGRAVAGVARPLERFAGAAERMTAEALGMAPEALRSTAATAGIAGALGIAPEAAAFAAIPAGIRTAREAGEALTRAGENLMTQPSRIGPLEAIGAAPGANLRQRMLGVVGQYGGDAALDASLRGIAGGIEGAAVGAGLGFLSGGEEGAAAGVGSGLAQGAAGALGARGFERLTGRAAKEARAGDLGRFIDGQQDPTTKALFERVRDTHGVDAASALMDVGALVKGTIGDIDINFLSDADFIEKHKGRARGVQIEVGDRPTLDINADIIGKGQGDTPLYTLSHELFHALEKSKQLSGAATEIKDALVGRWVQEGDVVRKLADGALTDAEIEARFNQYRDKLAVGNPERAAQLAELDTINKKADYIASELAAEHFASLLAGQKPDALLKGFSGLTRQLMDAALTQNAVKAISNAAASIERTFGVKPTDSVLFPDLKQASPQVNAMLRDLVRARNRLDEKIMLESEQGGRVLKPEDAANPLAGRELVDMGVAEQMPDGSIRNLSNEEVRARDDKDMTSLRSITENIPGSRVVDGVFLGRFSPEQLSAIEQSQSISSRMKDKIRGMNAALANGNSIHVVYSAALKRAYNRITKKYSPKYDSGIRVSEREVLPYAFYLSKADNPLVKVIDITKVRNALTKELAKDGSIGGLWENTDGFMGDLAKYFTNLDQKEGARRSYEIFGDAKARFLGDFVNAQEKGGRKFVRDLRLDRIGSMSPMDFRARISEDAIQLSKNRWMPAETVGDKSVINSEEGYRIISGAKHRLYGPDGKLLGIYDTQTQAERKADATQARLQPEVSQQQRQAGDEGRQATEAGGRNRIERGQEGQGQGGAVRQEGDVIQNFDALVAAAPDVRFMPVESQPENAPVAGRITKGQQASIDELSQYYASKTPDRAKVLKSDAIDSLASRLINKGVPVQEANAIASKTFSKLRKGVSGAMQVISGMGLSDLSRMAGTGKPTVERRSHVNQNWLTSAFEAFATDEGLALMKAQQVATQLNKADQAKAAAGESVEAARASGVRQSTMQQGMEFVLGEMNADRKAFGTSLREDLDSPPRVYASVGEGQKFGGQGNYNVFFEWKKETPMVATSHHHYGVANGVTGIHAQGNIGDKNARSFGNPSAEKYDTLPSGKQVLDTHLLVGNQGVPDARAHQLTVSIPDSSLSGIRKVYKDKGAAGVEAELNRIAVNQMVGTKSQGKTQSFTSKEGIPPVVAIQKNRTEAYVMDPDLANVASVTIVSNSPKEVALIRKNLESAFANNGSALPKVKVVSAESGASGNVGRKAITDEYFKLTGEQRFMPSDTDYLSAVKQGDTKAAQQMVDEAAKAAGYTTKVFHGSISQFNKPNTPLFLGDEGTAMSYAQDRAMAYGEGANPVTYKIYAKFKNTASESDVKQAAMDLGLEVENDMAYTALDPQISGSKYVSRVISELKKRGYDSANIDDFSPDSAQNVIKSFVAFDPSQLKRSDPITKDDAGNVIPLSKRFQKTSDDIRYMPSDDEYLNAVKRGSTKAAQDMVDAAAKAAGYTIGPVYHGTPTGGFNVFDKRMRGETSGVSRQAFSFTTDKKAAEGYSKRLGDEAVRLDAGLRVANDAMRMFDEDIAAQEYFSSKGYSSVDDGMLPEFDWGSIDDVPEFIKELRGYAKDLKPINANLANSFVEAAKVMASTKAVPEVKRVFLRIPENAPVFQATPATLGQVMSGFSAEKQPTKAGIVELPGGDRIYYVADSSQVKLADPVTKDSQGNVIPLSQRFKASEDIRYMPSPDSAMPGAYSFQGGYRAIPGKAKGSLRIYGPAGSLLGIASSLEEAQRILRRKTK